ncbi:chloramphenicol acetyltransferase [Sinomicrobium kalidii]|uniref:chloramphenicol acetyltransferase n=1 Tax=Sinomicrobium kalidii TaxID=2900738 RepID=UPI001E5C5222|nr:chloramphenicol acetyltransferase [Sinomicrobium kalidii]UGU16612.1 chloramphenicol acetyltransferase [Sinomicrobium kalidii]
MTEKLDIENWNRKEHFFFFKDFEEPFFGVTFNVDITGAYRYCKQESISLFIYYLYASLKTANNIPEFKYRIKDNEVLVYDRVSASSTIDREDGTFGFSYINYEEDFVSFRKNAQSEIDRVRSTRELIPSESGDSVIHFSAIPWVQFTSLSHARSFRFKDSVPKISFGRIFEKENKKWMPVSVHVHHALMDGYHVGRFVRQFQQELN